MKPPGNVQGEGGGSRSERGRSISGDHKTLKESATAFPAASCNACHAAAAADDFVFTQYYPVLRGAKAAGEEGTGGKRSKLSRALSMGE